MSTSSAPQPLETSNNSHNKEYDVVVIGACLSGLQAAVNIQPAGLSCAVLEAIDRVGGKLSPSAPTVKTKTEASTTSAPPGSTIPINPRRNTALGTYGKMIFVFHRPWWRGAGPSGVMESSTDPIIFNKNNSVPADNQWSIACFLVGQPGRELSKYSKAKRRELVWN
ncbi:hypothetical protein QBC35DRAFT_507801 [Podospora australis]|uniref:FAD-dependent oxidoreductase 2 FAD-binding domain-containing protein n=1 Tax=Podospora australis TaxID=1536484 RepID=A0AAN6WKG7_9PEZI|nr:hypothetical protein QBC35DRAFT_507801 [Podospora australis]